MRESGWGRRSQRAAALAAAVTGAAAWASLAGDASALDQRAYNFQITWSIAPALTLSKGVLRLEQDDDAYSVEMEAEANLTFPRIDWRGLFAVEGDRESLREAEGRVSGLRVAGALAAAEAGDAAPEGSPLAASLRAPQNFERSSIRPDVREDVSVSWGDPSAPPETLTSRIPESARIRRERIEPESTIGVVDPITFALGLLDTVEASDGLSCDLDARTWDGARLSELEVRTEEVLRGSFAECRLKYRSIRGLREDNPWRSREDDVDRIIRFEKRLGRWDPVSIRIRGRFLGFESEFVTQLEPQGALR